MQLNTKRRLTRPDYAAKSNGDAICTVSFPGVHASEPHTSHMHRTLLASSPPPFLNTSSLPAPVIKCPGGLLIPSPSALALCSTLLLFLSFSLSPRYSTLFSCNKTKSKVKQWRTSVCRTIVRMPVPPSGSNATGKLLLYDFSDKPVRNFACSDKR